MTTEFLDGVLSQIGKALRYEAMANYAGNSFFKDSHKVIEEYFPLKSDKVGPGNAGIEQLFRGVRIAKASSEQANRLKKNREAAKAAKESNHGEKENSET